MTAVIRLVLVVMIAAGAAVATGSTAAAQTISGLQTPPPDSAEAWRVRVWVPQERPTSCRLTVEILDDSNRVIRHLVDFIARRGYYNFYWDKRDDSGKAVPAGEYRYVGETCGHKHYGTVTAQYTHWEQISELEPYDPDNPLRVAVTLKEDSVPVAIYVLNSREIVRETIAADTVLEAGRHVFEHEPQRLGTGNYIMDIHVGEHVYRREVTYLE